MCAESSVAVALCFDFHTFFHTTSWEILLKFKAIYFGDHFINSHNLFSLSSIDIMRRHSMLVTPRA